jgi:para-nitrobenzyl esterase
MHRRTLSLGASLAVIALAFCTSREARANVAEGASRTIVTDQGPLKGINTPTESKYLGIPYAAAPVGNLRWRPPEPPAHFKGVFQATQFGNFCPQPDFGSGPGNEDCLFLNVYVRNVGQNQQPPHGFPVMVWIHPGGLHDGAGSFFDPTPLVEKGGVIVVTINYRLGILGFFAHPALDAEDHLRGNYGLMDQQLALKWVERNIGAFGGDHKRVTIFGESAGGLSVYSHLASPTAAGLFQRAIAESGAVQLFQHYFDTIVPLATGETTGVPLIGMPSGTDFATSVGCSSQTAQCLRAISAAALVKAEPGTFYPFVDGTVLTQTLDSAFASGQINRVPVISGSNHDENRVGVASQYDLGPLGPLADAGYTAAVAAVFGAPESDPFVQLLVNVLYPLSNYPPQPPGFQSAPLALSALTTDICCACPTRNADLSLSRYVATFAYEFSDENAPLPFGIPPVSFPLGAYHTAEIQYLIDLSGTPPATFTSNQQQLSDTMIAYWTQFAKTGNPNLAGAPAWSPFSASTPELQSLVPPAPVAESDSEFDSYHKCSSLWDTL